MQMQDLSYKLHNKILEVDDSASPFKASVSIEVFSLDNVYTCPNLSPMEHNYGHYEARDLEWGNSESVNGYVGVDIMEGSYGKLFKINAWLEKEEIRCVKLRLDNLPIGTLTSTTDEDKMVREYGDIYTYPEGWRELSTPLLVFRLDGNKYLYIRTLDTSVNIKRFYVKKVGKCMRVDVVQEQDGTNLSNNYDVPMIECGITDYLDYIYDSQSEIISKTYSLKPFSESNIVPSWLDNISLVVTMHMESFTGYVFHTYENALKDVERLTAYINGKNILVYLAGWEGRYYYDYGKYEADSRLGGEIGLKKCVDGLHKLGCKVIAMYGINYANKNIPEIEELAEESEFVSISGARFHNGSVDWDGAHHYDYGGLVNLNIASPKWSEYLFKQIRDNTLKYNFDGAFLDIAAVSVNDRRYRLYDGVVDFANRLRTIKEDFLVAGEGYYDGLAKAMPLFQSGHTDGKLNYHDRVSSKLFTRYAREFAHLCLGDPSRGSTGVHELGTNTETMTPLRKGIIPTLSLVDGSLYDMSKVEKTINQAKKYGEINHENA